MASYLFERDIGLLKKQKGIFVSDKSPIKFQTTRGNVATSGTSLSENLCVCPYSNRILVVSELSYRYVATGITYNGDALTNYISNQIAVGSHNMYNRIWYLVAPDVGSHDITVSTASSGLKAFTASVFYGVDQVNPIRTSASATTSASYVMYTEIPNAIQGDMLVDSICNGETNPPSFSPSSYQTLLGFESGTQTYDFAEASSYKPCTEDNLAMSWEYFAGSISHIIISLKPA